MTAARLALLNSEPAGSNDFAMRLGVLDVGSNSIKLQIVDAGPGQAPLPVRAFTTAVKLAERGTTDGEISDRAVDRLITAIGDALAVADQQDVGELLCFATEAIRSAPNQEAVCKRVRSATSVDVKVLTGENERHFGVL